MKDNEPKEWTSIIYYRRWAEMLMGMPAELRHKIHDAIDEYIISQTDPEEQAILYSPYWSIRDQIDYDKKLYENRIIERNKMNGAKGGRPKKNPNNPVGLEKPKKADNDNVNDNVSTNVDKKKSIKEKATRFSTPTIEEVKAYCQERKNYINPERFIDFYQSKNWMIGKNKMKDWKAAVRTWEHKEEQKGGSNESTQEYIIPD